MHVKSVKYLKMISGEDVIAVVEGEGEEDGIATLHSPMIVGVSHNTGRLTYTPWAPFRKTMDPVVIDTDVQCVGVYEPLDVVAYSYVQFIEYIAFSQSTGSVDMHSERMELSEMVH
jgi:hypothetical protein